jgi:hypothetical protein
VGEPKGTCGLVSRALGALHFRLLPLLLPLLVFPLSMPLQAAFESHRLTRRACILRLCVARAAYRVPVCPYLEAVPASGTLAIAIIYPRRVAPTPPLLSSSPRLPLIFFFCHPCHPSLPLPIFPTLIFSHLSCCVTLALLLHVFFYCTHSLSLSPFFDISSPLPMTSLPFNPSAVACCARSRLLLLWGAPDVLFHA